MSPGAQARGRLAEEAAARLAGGDGGAVALNGVSEQAFRRPLGSGEIRLLRATLLGFDPDLYIRNDEAPAAMVGYVCAGRGSPRDGEDVIAVSDHVNLAWRSPLTGHNDDRMGPRFPVVAGLYVPQEVMDRVGVPGGPPIREGVVAGVRDDRDLLRFESEAIREAGLVAYTSELVPVALLAAHMGLPLAAVVVIAGS